MCRWIVYLGQQAIILEDVLIKPDHSIVKQVNVRFLPGLYYGLEDSDVEELKQKTPPLNVHGFGVAWFTRTLSEFDPSVKGMQPALFKTIAPISSDIAFRQLCGHTASSCVLAHIRASSFLPVVEVNNHPFVFGKYAFMHNGGVNAFDVIRFDVLSRIYQLQEIVKATKSESSVPKGNYIFNIRGNTDTEHLATLFFAHLDLVKAGIVFFNSKKDRGIIAPSAPFGVDSTNAMLLALILTIADIQRIQSIRLVGPFTPDSDRVGNSLNLCITDGGEQMLACRWRDANEGYPPSLYLSLTAGEKLNRKYHPESSKPVESQDLNNTGVKINSIKEVIARYRPDSSRQGPHVIISSEPCTREVHEWGLFDQNQCLTLDKNGKLRILDLAKFFRPGREHEFEKYKFSDICAHISYNNNESMKARRSVTSKFYSNSGLDDQSHTKSTLGVSGTFDTPIEIGVPQESPSLPESQSFEVELDLK